MKKWQLVALLLLCLFQPGWAQTMQTNWQDDADFPTQIESVFQNVNLQEATSGFLYDYGMRFDDLKLFNGQLQEENLTDIDIWGGVYASLYDCNIDATIQLPDPIGYMSLANSYDPEIGINYGLLLLQDFDTIRGDAIDLNLLSVQNDQLYDVPNRPFSPFNKTRAFVFSLVGNTLSSATMDVTLGAASVFGNLGSQIASLEADWDDGIGYQPLVIGTTYTISYPSRGEKRPTLKCTLSNGAILYAHSKLDVETPSSNRFNENPDFVHVINPTSGHKGIEINVFYNCQAGCQADAPCRLRKPLIVIDGFDPLNTREYGNLINRIEIKPFDITDPSDPRDFHDFLEQEGYDLIFLNYLDGGDYIQKNAAAVSEAIEWINQQKSINGSNEANIVIGASMGAVVGRYALLDMEEKGKSHDVSKFFSLDGPMWGANLPLGIQAGLLDGIELFYDPLISVSAPGLNIQVAPSGFVPNAPNIYNTLETLITAPATRQLALNIIPELTSRFGFHPSLATDFFNELHAKGVNSDGLFVNCEAILLCSGSINGVGQEDSSPAPVAPNQKMIDINGWLHVGTQFSSNNVIANYFASAINVLARGSVHIDLDIWSAPMFSSGMEKVYRKEVFVSVLNIVPVYYSKKTYKVAFVDPIDTAPGGLVTEPFNLLAPVTFPPIVQSQLTWNINFDSWCFVPSVSATDVGFPTSSNIFNTSVGTFFVRVYGSRTNEIVLRSNDVPHFNTEHAYIHSEMAKYILYEIGTSNVSMSGDLGDVFNYGNAGSGVLPYNSSPNSFNDMPFNSTSHIIRDGLRIVNNGKILVNHANRIAFVNNLANPQNQTGASFEVYISEGFNCPSSQTKNVIVGGGGEIIVGDWNGGQNIGALKVGDKRNLRVNNNGLLKIDNASSIVVQNGGLLHLRRGSLFEVSGNGKIVIESGGKLIIEEGASISLLNPDSKIEIEGTLQLNGQPEFTGPGYWHFLKGNTVAYADNFDKWQLVGTGKGNRMMVLDGDLDIPAGKSLDLRAGKVVYHNSSRISLFNQGTFESVSTVYQGEVSNTAVHGSHLIGMDVLDCSFYGFDKALVAEYTPDISIIQGYFENNTLGLHHLAPASEAYVLYSEFVNSPIYFDHTRTVRLHQSTFRDVGDVAQISIGGNDSDIEPPYVHGTPGAVNLANVAVCDVRESDFLDNEIGINAAGNLYAGDLNDILPSNIELYKSTFLDNGLAVAMNGNEQIGSVTAACCTFKDNKACFSGTDIRLGISALNNAPTAAGYMTNVFEIPGWGPSSYNKIFMVLCYSAIDARSVGSDLLQGNEWLCANPTNPSEWIFIFEQNGCGGDDLVNPVLDPMGISSEPNACNTNYPPHDDALLCYIYGRAHPHYILPSHCHDQWASIQHGAYLLPSGISTSCAFRQPDRHC